MKYECITNNTGIGILMIYRLPVYTLLNKVGR